MRRERFDEFRHRPGGERYRYQLDRIDRKVGWTLTLVGVLIVVMIVMLPVVLLRR